jgi:mono/diheme cytochrome c family protein
MHAPEARALVNPVAATPASIERGKKMYSVHCAVCHADDGMASPAEAPVAGRLAAFGAPPFPLASVPAYEDGQIYTKIRYGLPMMPAYPQISDDDRWHIVNYLRTMFPRS